MCFFDGWTIVVPEVTIDDSDDEDMQYEEVPDVPEDDDEEDFQTTLATLKHQPSASGMLKFKPRVS